MMNACFIKDSFSKFKAKKFGSSSPGQRGFALVATVLVMSLLLMVALGTISLTQSESKITLNERYQAVAEANARMALQEALAELQLAAGPDQRVSATASLLDGDIKTPLIDGVANPYWTGIWKSTNDQDKPLIQRNDIGDSSLNAAGLLDERTKNPLTSPEAKRDSAIKWLVSHPHGTTLDPIADYSGEKITLVSPADSNGPEVSAPMVRIKDNGSYAWWVGDEGVKARLAIDHPYYDKVPDKNNPDEGYSWLTAAPSLQHKAIQEDWQDLEKSPERILSRQSLTLANSQIDKSKFHDYTVYSSGLLTDTLRGGLRKDLSEFLLGGDQPVLTDGNGVPHSAGLNVDSNLIGPRDAVDSDIQGITWQDTKHQRMAPRFGLLKSWLALGNDAAGNGNKLPLTLPNYAHIPEDAFINTKLYDLQKQTKAAFKPLMVEGSVYQNITYRRVSDSDYRLRLHLYPRVVLWNPYSTSITTDRLVVYLRVIGVRDLELKDSEGTYQTSIRMPSMVLNGPYGGGISTGSLIFELEPTTIGPGECLVFSKVAAGSTRYEAGVVSLNKLSANTPPATKNFYIDNAIAKSFNTKPSNLTFRFKEGGRIEDLSLDLKAYPGSAPAFFNQQSTCLDWVDIQKINYHHAFGDGSNPETGTGWRTSDQRPVDDFTTAMLDEPYYKTRDGARLRWLEETPTNLNHLGQNQYALQASPIINNNAQAHISVRTPYDSLFQTAEPKFFGNFVRDVWDSQVSWSSTSPIPLGNGKFGGNPFSSPQDWTRPRYVLFELPKPGINLTSLAQLQHAPLSALSWQPSYAVGNSWANPRAPLTGTAPKWESYGGWNPTRLENNNRAIQARDLVQVSAFGHTGTASRGTEPDQLQHDLSYELNHQLWDRFYMSGSKHSDVQAYLTSSSKDLLANPRLRRMPANAKPEADFHHSARHLSIIGSFNVNSTSVEAWKALLLTTRNMSPLQDPDAKDRSAYPRFMGPLSRAADTIKPDQSNNTNDAWSGYRSLSDTQVELLAQKIVEEVKTRGPFISLSDFVNRRLTEDETGLRGALQAAIDKAELNTIHDDFAINHTELKSASGQIIRENQKAKPMHTTAGAPNYLQQADILQPLGPSLSARSDTFIIRTCGQAYDPQGKVKATAYCEAVVQRTTDPVAPDTLNLDPAKANTPDARLGRRFRIVSFRWLNKNEI